MSKDILKTLDNGLLVISHLAKTNSPISVTELAKQVGINKSTIFRILNTLEKRGFVNQYDDSSYGLRVEEFQMIADKFDSKTSLLRIARSEIEKASQKCQETITLSSLVGNEAQCIDKVDSNASVHVTHMVGRFSPLYAAATGKAILAFLPEKKLMDYLEDISFEQITDTTITTKSKLINELNETRSLGYATSHGELDIGVSAVAAPIFNRDGDVIGAVSVLGITQEFLNKKIGKYGKLVVESGLSISKRLNYRGTVHSQKRND